MKQPASNIVRPRGFDAVPGVVVGGPKDEFAVTAALAPTLEDDVPDGALEDAAVQGGAPPMPPPSLETLLEEVRAFLLSYVVFPKEEQAAVIALWIVHTWVLEAFTFTPYLSIASPVKRCGKSTLLDCLKVLVRRAWPAVTPSPAVLYRKIEKDCPTLLLDEVDTIFTASKGDDGKEELRAVLNAGFQRGAKVPRCVGPNHDLQEFAVFCPKALAGIGKLPDTVADRSVPVVLARKAPGQGASKFRYRDVTPRAEALNARLAAWSQTPSLIATLAAATPEAPETLSDRAADICEPLLAIADLAGGDWPDYARAALVTLLGAIDAEDDNLPAKLLAGCRDIFTAAAVDAMATGELLAQLVDREDDTPWAHWWEKDLSNGNTRGPAARLAKMLKPFGVYPKTVRIGQETQKGYTLETFEDAFSRYLPREVVSKS